VALKKEEIWLLKLPKFSNFSPAALIRKKFISCFYKSPDIPDLLIKKVISRFGTLDKAFELYR